MPVLVIFFDGGAQRARRISRICSHLNQIGWRPKLRTHLPRPAHHIFIGGEFLDAGGAAGVKTARGDADFRAETELAAIGELRRGVVHDDGAVDFGKEPLRRRFVFRDDGFGV